MVEYGSKYKNIVNAEHNVEYHGNGNGKTEILDQPVIAEVSKSSTEKLPFLNRPGNVVYCAVVDECDNHNPFGVAISSPCLKTMITSLRLFAGDRHLEVQYLLPLTKSEVPLSEDEVSVTKELLSQDIEEVLEDFDLYTDQEIHDEHDELETNFGTIHIDQKKQELSGNVYVSPFTILR